jgi:dienelactone hydrolase
VTRHVRGARPGALALAVLLLGVAVAPVGATTTAGKQPGFTSWDETFVDESRPTEPSVGTPSPSRTLVTTIYRPRGRGPFPLIMFSHGLSGHPDKFTELFAAWAEAGFVVAAPAFPLTNDHLDGSSANAADVENQPDDVKFVLDEVLNLGDDRASRLHRAIDPDRIGAGGLSLGGATTYLLAFSECCRDERIQAVQILDGILLEAGGAAVTLDGHVPVLIAHADTDPAIPYAAARAAFDEAQAPAWFLTFYGASHATQWEDDDTPYDELAETLTTHFWNATLKGKKKAFTRLEADASVPDLSSLEVKR